MAKRFWYIPATAFCLALAGALVFGGLRLRAQRAEAAAKAQRALAAEAEEREQQEERERIEEKRKSRRAAADAMRGKTIEQAMQTSKDPLEIIAAMNLDQIRDESRRAELGVLLAAWSITRLKWDHVTGPHVEKTSPPMVQKDELGETGKAFCSSTKVELISTGRTEDNVAFDTALVQWDGVKTTMYAFGSTQGIVAGSEARYCAMFLFTRGDRPTVIGLFDNAANRAR